MIRFVGPNHALEIFGIRLVGFNTETAGKLLFTVVLIALFILITKTLRWARDRIGTPSRRAGFWYRQGVNVFMAIGMTVGLVSIWFDDPVRLTGAMGLLTAGVAFALQRVITALAGYILILRGKTFNVGDRIVMGGVRGDVVALGFMQTTIMEMGQPPPVQKDDPAMWVQARQYTGRIVTVSNAKIFDEPVYNYSREFPYIWEELKIPISYHADRERAEQILLDATSKHSVKIADLGEDALRELERRYVIKRSDMKPRVFLRITDNWLELTVRFIAKDHGVRELKDALAREILPALEESGIGIASATFEITGLPSLRIERVPARQMTG